MNKPYRFICYDAETVLVLAYDATGNIIHIPVWDWNVYGYYCPMFAFSGGVECLYPAGDAEYVKGLALEIAKSLDLLIVERPEFDEIVRIRNNANASLGTIRNSSCQKT